MIENKNVFEVLRDAVRVRSLGQITNALFEVGGQIPHAVKLSQHPPRLQQPRREAASAVKPQKD